MVVAELDAPLHVGTNLPNMRDSLIVGTWSNALFSISPEGLAGRVHSVLLEHASWDVLPDAACDDLRAVPPHDRSALCRPSASCDENAQNDGDSDCCSFRVRINSSFLRSSALGALRRSIW